MHTKETLKEFTLGELFELMILKLQEFDHVEKYPRDMALDILMREELELIERIIDERKTSGKP